MKFGALRDPAGGWLGVDARPAAVKNFLAYTLSRLGTDHVDVYRPARLDPRGPDRGDRSARSPRWSRPATCATSGSRRSAPRRIRRAAAVHPISDLQIEYSLLSRGIEDEILPACRELGIGVTAYGVLSRGLLSGHWSRERALTAGDFRAHSPRFQGENLERNLALVEALRAVAEARGATVAQAAIAWVLSRGDDIVPLVGRAHARAARRGARRRSTWSSTTDDLAGIEAAVPAGAAAGARYAEPLMAELDSER